MDNNLSKRWDEEICRHKEFYKLSYLDTVNSMINYIKVYDGLCYDDCLMIITKDCGAFTSSVHMEALITIRRSIMIGEILESL